MKVIDTDIFIDALHGVEKAEKFLTASIENIDAFSAITESELLAGKDCDSKEKREAILHLLSLLTKISVDNPIAQIAGDLRRNYNIALPDALIAATALHLNTTLVTRNVKDFSTIREIKIESPY